MADKPLRGITIYRTLLIWPYAVAPPVVGVLWVFMLHPSLGDARARAATTWASTGIRCSTATRRRC